MESERLGRQLPTQTIFLIMPVLYQPQQILGSDDTPSYDACPSFEGGQVSKVQPKLLAQNQAAQLQNMDISPFSVAQTRRGTNALGGSSLSTGHTIQGLRWFFPPTLSLLIAAVNGALQKWDNSSWTALTGYTPANNTVGVEMAQGINKLYATDGINDIFSWDGTSWFDIGINNVISVVSHSITSNVATITTATDISQVLATGTLVNISNSNNAIFNVTNQSITVTSGITFTFPLTNANIATTADTTAKVQNVFAAPITPYIFWFTNRLFSYGLSTNPTQINASNILDGSTWNTGINSFNVGSGDGDPIVACVPWTDTTFVVLKKNSIYAVDADPTIAISSWTIGTIHRKVGCVAHRSAVQVGDDIWFLSADGVRSVQRIESQDQNEVNTPISLPIQDIIERINPLVVQNSCAVFWNNRYILSIPVDNSTTNNYTIVYNTLTQSWSGFWTGWTPTVFELIFFSGTPGRMVFGQTDGRVSAWHDFVLAANATIADYQDDGVDIPSSITTRSLTFSEPFSPKKGISFEMEFISSQAIANVSIIQDLGSTQQIFSGSTTGAQVMLPVFLPFFLESSGTYKKALDLMQYQPFREIQFQVAATAGNLSVRTILSEAFLDTIVLET